MSDALEGLAAPDDPNLLVGIETSDDAAVYRLTDEIAMISTVDFITPPVDDPYWFGQISAANSISDVYSMGGKPLTALNVVMFPSKHLDMYKKGETTGSNKANRQMVAKHILDMNTSLSSHEEELLYDPQTSGGLLLSLPSSQADELVQSFSVTSVSTAVKIGEITDESVGITIES